MQKIAFWYFHVNGNVPTFSKATKLILSNQNILLFSHTDTPPLWCPVVTGLLNLTGHLYEKEDRNASKETAKIRSEQRMRHLCYNSHTEKQVN